VHSQAYGKTPNVYKKLPFIERLFARNSLLSLPINTSKDFVYEKVFFISVFCAIGSLVEPCPASDVCIVEGLGRG
jgi:hypothetical protein